MISKLIKKHSEFILITFIGFITITWNKLFLCQQGAGLGFDAQSFLFWDYAHSLNLIPFKDFFYPYGLLFYLKTDSILWHSLSLVILLCVTGCILSLLKRIAQDKLHAYTFFISFCLFANMFLDYDSFLRYSPMLALSFLVAHFANKNKIFNKFFGFCLGLILGLLFSFMNDIFFYGALTTTIFILIYSIFLKKKNFRNIVHFTIFIVVGVFVGLLPLLLYLVNNGAVTDLIENYRLLYYVSSFAKIPFPPTLKSFENLFLIAVIVISIISIVPNILRKDKLDFSFYIKLALVIAILLLEQKNIVRAFYEQFSIFGFVLLLILLNEFRIRLEKRYLNKRIVYVYVLSLIVLVFALIYLDRGQQPLSNVQTNIAGRCVDNKIAVLDKEELRKYKRIREFIQKDKNAKIFSFPGDPIFYALFNQKPPYYPSIYEATPIFAQEKLIQYIKNAQVKYVIYNTKISAIQDGVPDKVRGKKLYNYIINNFSKKNRIDNFLILEKKR